MGPLEQALLYVVMGIIGFLLPLSPLSNKSYRFTSYLNFIAVPGQFFIIYLLRGVIVADIDVFLFTFLYSIITMFLILTLTNKMEKSLRGSTALNAVFVNSLNLPLPLLQVLTGSFTYAATYAAASNMAQLISAKTLQIRLNTHSQNKTSVRNLQAIEAAPLLLLLIGVIFHYVALDSIQTISLSNSLNNILAFLLAINFLYFGASLQKSIQPKIIPRLTGRPLMMIALFRVLLGPLVAISLAIFFFRTNGVAFSQLLFVSMMPPAIINTALCGIYGFDQNFSARSTLILTPLNVLEALSVFFVVRSL